MKIDLKHLTAYVDNHHVALALQLLVSYCDRRRYPSRPLQSRYELGKMKLWEPSTHPDACWGIRFSWLTKGVMPGSGSSEERFQSHLIDTSTMSAKDKAYWTGIDKIWAWGEYLKGADVETICTFVGGRKSDFIDWVKAVCRGEESCDYGGSFGDYNDPNGWTPRHDRILWAMYEARLEFRTARRLLGKSHENTKRRIQILKDEKQKR